MNSPMRSHEAPGPGPASQPQVNGAIRARLQISYPEFRLEVELDLPGRGVSALFGPSGCGKTTCLRAIAGLERAPAGYLQVNDAVWQDESAGRFLPTHQRPLGYVFQDANLFEHLTVRGNVEYGHRRVPAAQRRVALEQAVELLGIGQLMQRRPGNLSGGERQRVAIARALATSPRLLLLDEPLAALDAQRKAEILPYLERLHGELAIPMLYVSHALDEVARLADHLVLLDAGRVRACGATVDLLTRLDLPLAHGDTAAAVVHGTVIGHDPGYHLLQVGFGASQGGAPAATLLLASAQARPTRQQLRLRIQARDVSLTLQPHGDSSVLNILGATVQALNDDSPGQTMVALDVGGTRLLARITRRSADALGLCAGLQVYAQIKGVAIVD